MEMNSLGRSMSFKSSCKRYDLGHSSSDNAPWLPLPHIYAAIPFMQRAMTIAKTDEHHSDFEPDFCGAWRCHYRASELMDTLQHTSSTSQSRRNDITLRPVHASAQETPGSRCAGRLSPALAQYETVRAQVLERGERYDGGGEVLREANVAACSPGVDATRRGVGARRQYLGACRDAAERGRTPRCEAVRVGGVFVSRVQARALAQGVQRMLGRSILQQKMSEKVRHSWPREQYRLLTGLSKRLGESSKQMCS